MPIPLRRTPLGLFAGLVAGLLVALAWSGCARKGDEMTRTERMRLTLGPEVKAFLANGQQALRQGAYQYALAMADSAARHAPELADAYMLRGTVYTVLNRLDAAQEAYDRVVELDPEYPGARTVMGNNALQRGRLREALRLYRAEEELAPTADVYVGIGRIYAELGQADSARTAFDAALALDSTSARTHVLYGQLEEETGDLEAALAHSRRALALEPDDVNYRFVVGSQLFRLGRLEEAAGYLRQAAEADPMHYAAQYNLGQVLTRLGRDEEAARYLARADSAQKLLDEITVAEQTAAREPQVAEHWTRLGDLFMEAEMYDRAVKAFNVAASARPADLALRHRLERAILAEQQQRERRALRAR